MPTARSIDRKLSKKADHRRIIVRTLATQLIEHGEITTTTPRAKVVKPYTERLVSSAVKGGLARRRKAISLLDTVSSANRLFDLIAPQMKRTSGFLATTKAAARSGDHTPMTTIKFVDSIANELTKADRKEATPKPTAKTKKLPAKVTKTAKARK